MGLLYLLDFDPVSARDGTPAGPHLLTSYTSPPHPLGSLVAADHLALASKLSFGSLRPRHPILHAVLCDLSHLLVDVDRCTELFQDPLVLQLPVGDLT